MFWRGDITTLRFKSGSLTKQHKPENICIPTNQLSFYQSFAGSTRNLAADMSWDQVDLHPPQGKEGGFARTEEGQALPESGKKKSTSKMIKVDRY